MKFWRLLGVIYLMNVMHAVAIADEIKADDDRDLNEIIVNPNVVSKLANEVKLTNEQKAVILHRHNEYRKNVEPKASNMRKLSWDSELSNISTEFTLNCTFSRSKGLTHSRFGRINENIYLSMGIPLRTDLYLDAISTWFSQQQDYDFVNGRCKKGKFCSSFTKLVLADTFKIGCGATLCSKIYVRGREWTDAILFACHYGPAGNFNKRPYKNGLPCSDCHPSDRCRHNLCENDMRDLKYASNTVATWGSWSHWSPCTRTCLGGLSRRQRICNTFVNSDCDGSTYQLSYTCGENMCDKFGVIKPNPGEEKWLPWESWSGCSVSCGVGIETRMRKCKLNEMCNGINKFTVPCDKGICPNSGWSNWNAWSSCDVSCGRGYRNRFRSCRGANPCRGLNEMKRLCNGSFPCPAPDEMITITPKSVETSTTPADIFTTQTKKETSSSPTSGAGRTTSHEVNQKDHDEKTTITLHLVKTPTTQANIFTTQTSKIHSSPFYEEKETSSPSTSGPGRTPSLEMGKTAETTQTILKTPEDGYTTASYNNESRFTEKPTQSGVVTTKPIDLFTTTSTPKKPTDEVRIPERCCSCCETDTRNAMRMIQLEEQNIKIQKERLEVEKKKLDIYTKMYGLMKTWKIEGNFES